MSLIIRDVALSYGTTQVLKGCSLEIGSGELICLVGPSGCGKTTLLNVIAGVLSPDTGSVEVGGNAVDGLPTRERNLAFIMDRLGLYPHLSVFENIAYPLRIRKIAPQELNARVTAICTEVGLDGLEQRRPHQLSAGQQQRVAIARALVRDDAALLLADESFSNLDAQLRYELRGAFRRWQRQRGVTTLFVTHDQEEALSLGDRIALMRSGGIEQFGTAIELYQDPATLFAARFFGVPRCNTVPMTGPGGVPTPFGAALRASRPDLIPKQRDGSLILGFRPEAVCVEEAQEGPGAGIPLSVDWAESAGADTILHLNGPDMPIAARVRGTPDLCTGRPVSAYVDPGAWMVFDEATGQRVR